MRAEAEQLQNCLKGREALLSPLLSVLSGYCAAPSPRASTQYPRIMLSPSLRSKSLQAVQAGPSQGICTWKENRGQNISTQTCSLFFVDFHRICDCGLPGNKNDVKPRHRSPLAKWSHCLVSWTAPWGGVSETALDRVAEALWETGRGYW